MCKTVLPPPQSPLFHRGEAERSEAGGWRSTMAHICICDDEEGILKYLKKVLKGHRVETFSSGSELLVRLESPADGEVDLLLQDLRMPDLDGLQIMKRLSQVRPELP